MTIKNAVEEIATALLVKVGGRSATVRREISRLAINKFAYATPPRPRALSMAANYTTWRSLTDRRFSGRHLPTATGEQDPLKPKIDEVVALFERTDEIPAEDTSLLFPFFAQWFVDSFLRTKWEDGEDKKFQENESNHEIDLCQIYGVTEVQTNMLRNYNSNTGKGLLDSQLINGEEWPIRLFEKDADKLQVCPRFRRIPEVDDDHPAIPGLYSSSNFRRVFESQEKPWTDEEKLHAFAVGLEHGNSTMGNMVMNTLFLREHNRNARLISTAHPEWDNERVFQTARNVTTVVLLNIVISDYIVHINPFDFPLEVVPGMAEKESWYRNNWMSVEFALLYRWHDLIPNLFTIAGSEYDSTKMLKANKFIVDVGLDQIILDASRQPAGRIGLGNTAKFLLPVKKLSINMARRCGLASYNSYRKHYGLKPIEDFDSLTGNTELAQKLKILYGSIDRLEWFVGLFAEKYGKKQLMGELMVRMVANDAFTQALTNPLLAANIYNEDTFSKVGFEIVRSTKKLSQVICRNTKISEENSVGFKFGG